MITDNLIQERLPRKEARELLNLIRKESIAFVFIKDIDQYIENYKEQLIQLREWKASPYSIARTENVLRCWELYMKVSDNKEACLIHWSKAWNGQKSIRDGYKKMARPPRQDNKTYLNTQTTYGSNKNKIRYPRKKRKTAWKRFYKLFPHLKPEDHG